MRHRFRAPKADGEVLAEPGFDAVPGLVEANRARLDRADVVVGGLSLHELRALARREALDQAGGTGDGPLLLAGHQPELSHPGVWVKNFALNGLARRLGGAPLNLIVDNDTLKSTAIRFPVLRDHDPASVHFQALNFDTLAGEVPYEDRTVHDGEQFRTFAERAAPLWADWGYEPLLAKHWAGGTNVGEAFTAMRVGRERAWGCRNLELPISRLARTDAFARFARHVLGDLPRFRAAYNAAIRAYRVANRVRSANHPAPELAEGEGPFWVRTGAGRRQRATPASDTSELRPRALTLTLFARVCLGDFFIHGIGGGKYDEVTDDIIRDYFGIEPPAYQVLSATLHLPLPAFPSTARDLQAAERRVRDLRWNPHARPDAPADLVREHARLAASEPPYGDHAARREWFRALQRVKEGLREAATTGVSAAAAEVKRIRSEVEANAILRRRDYPWVLYPEDTLRPFLTGAGERARGS
ncbi:hypothetical protein R5W23_001884 [Gemmata sp. JC673]|uniref:Uncharacterized protein n=1 Tax=Gemmata algarum TaxID=2975278 RepID=A0ABU5F3C9_9BACT|nr:hypothetical protein [Gemmata algarum]MDY3560638.1 hypothetical protein [Gemmata algarum]